jgi:hypothetical protein
MGAYRYRGMMVLVLWQAVPVGPATDEAGRTVIGFGFGGGRLSWEHLVPGCDGTETRYTSTYSILGADLEHRVGERTRLHGSVGHVEGPQYTDFIGAGLVAVEGAGAGAGLGAAVVPRPSGTRLLPAAYLRIGAREAVHFRADFAVPAADAGGTGLGRLGVGLPLGTTAGAQGFAGVALCHFCSDGSGAAGGFGEVRAPVAGRVGFRLSTLLAPGEHALHYHFGLGLSVDVGGGERLVR